MTQLAPVARADRRARSPGLRPIGIDVVGDAPWGTHFCQFYATREDLADVLVPYFKAGLEADEFCMWITSPPLGVDEAWAALARAVPDLAAYRARGRIEILPYDAWYLVGGAFDQDRVLRGWVSKLEDALARGCAGLRLSGNTFWLEKADWRTFSEYEATIDRVLGQYKMLALCTYSLDRCGASEVADVIRNHEFALMKRDGAWEVIESDTRRRMAEALRDSERRVREKLEAVLAPDGDVGALELEDLVDAEALQSLMEDFHALARIPMAVIDARGKILVGVGWSEICTRFHRVHPETCRHCVESDTQLAAGVPSGEFRLYRCKNNMWDVATPVVVAGRHLGNVFSGQFFFDDERPDRELFEAQAARYGFDRAAYLAALDAVPRLSRETVNAAMSFFLKLAAMLSQLGYQNVRLARSVDERERLMESLRESKRQLEDTDRRKDEFLATLSHELRNPLAPIRNSIYVLERAAPGSERAERSKAVLRRQAEHLTRLVDDLLDVTRISRGKIELQRQRVDLREIVRKAADDRRSEFDRAGVALRVADGAGPAWVDADATRLAQVIGNLLQNAVKFTPAGGRVELAVAASGDRVELRVRDDGIGIEPGEVERMFEPFAQAEGVPGRGKGGLGLGLALVRGLVELHGGTARAHSDGPGRGSEFVVTLPRCGPEAAGPSLEAAFATEPRRVVLVVEDNADVGQSVADLLELHGHTVRVARDGRSGLALARELRPDVVICDIGLPDLDGYEVARALRRDEALRGARLVALSGFAQEEDRRRARDAGFDVHIAKPPDPVRLAAAVAADDRRASTA
jgi:signal transduction histidine kinase/ActR/RegA family two-component response regulator